MRGLVRREGAEVGQPNLVEACRVALPGPHLAGQHVVPVPDILGYWAKRGIGYINIVGNTSFLGGALLNIVTNDAFCVLPKTTILR